MALISPGLQLSVTDESQYVPGAVGSTPLVILATAQDKTSNGSYATGTSKANAGKLQVFTSQRELVSALGYPEFKQSAAGTPLHGSALNEYGLMAAYSTLAIANRVYAIRADIDLDELEPTSVRPVADPEDATLWLDLGDSAWGINEWDKSRGAFVTKEPIVIFDLENDATVITVGGVPIYLPSDGVGVIGDYAVVCDKKQIRYFHKSSRNRWRLVGSTVWQIENWPTVVGSVPAESSTIQPNDSIIINGQEVIFTGNTLETVVSDITVRFGSYTPGSPLASGVRAVVNGDKLEIFASADAVSGNDGANKDGIVKIEAGQGNGLASVGLTAGEYRAPATFLGSYIDVPNWILPSETRPSGSVYIKTSAIGGGLNLALKQFNAESSSWNLLAVPAYPSEQSAIYGFDPIAGGFSVQLGTSFVQYDNIGRSYGDNRILTSGVTLNIFYKTLQGRTSRKRSGSGLTGGTIILRSTQPGTDELFVSSVITINSGDTSDEFKSNFVRAIVTANAPEVFAQYDSSTGSVTVGHLSGGTIWIETITGSPMESAGFSKQNTRSTETEYVISSYQALDTISNRTDIDFDPPYTSPNDGTHWYFGDPTQVDIMINDGSAWRGYRTLASDARGYDLTNTDANGPIISPTKPKTQNDGISVLRPGDIWLDTSDLENYPKLYRYNTQNKWVAIDNTDRISQNGIIFADARWDADTELGEDDEILQVGGMIDPIVGEMPDLGKMLISNYVDLDAPNPRLYPRGTLLFNTRRSGFNVKKYVGDYFNEDSFPNETLPDVRSSWVSVSGLKDNGAPYMGAQAQRNMVVKAMRSAIDGNTQVREDQFFFNLIAAPGYPEVITNMVALNNDRKNTAFVIGDTPMTLPTDSIAVANWANNVNGDGLSTADPYLGIFYPAGLTNDVDGNTIVVPASHMMLRTFIRNDNVSYPWFAPAGTRRGLIDNATDIGYINPVTGGFNRNGINQGMRDALYENRVNPLTILPGVGLVAWGQKTRNPTASAMDRVNVARLVNYIRTILASVGNGFLFEPNDKITRDQIKSIIEGAMNDLVAKRGIYDYLVVCDSTNNTPERIARNELYVDIAIEPMKAVEFIYIPIRLKNPGDIAKLGG
jgi:hypothetical protein